MSKAKTPSKPKSAAKAAPAKAAPKAAPNKAPVKAASKKTAPKTTPKPAAKQASDKAPAKSVTKPATKPAEKKTTSSKAPVKSAAKGAVKGAAKSPAKGAAKTATESKPKTPRVKLFLVDQKVVYPSQGVGVIREIVQKKFKDAKIPYYIIYLEVTDMTIMVPVDRAVELGIRPAVSRDEANKALELIQEDYDPIPSDWKMRYQMNLDLLKKGSIRDIASIVRSLYHRSKVKELPILERKLYDSALKLFIDEVAISLRKPKDEVESIIFSKLENE